jgi:hypothetical protein
MKPADPENKILIRVESSTGTKQEEHLLCKLHFVEYSRIKKKGARPEF